MEKQQTYAEQLRQVRDSLTKDNWWKGAYFKLINDRICMCAHAAAQRIVNPEIRKVFASKIKDAEILIYRAGEATTPASAESSKAYEAVKNYRLSNAFSGTKRSQNLMFRTVWITRSNDVRETHHQYGNLNLHYLMGMFGVTVSFNDLQGTTLDMIKDRLSEAAKWAEKNEKFLRNN